MRCRRTSVFSRCLLLGSMMVAAVGCVPKAEDEVVIYSALDQEFSAPILAAFSRSTEKQIKPLAKFDVESTKTVGLVNRLISEQDRVVCDVFWNNEILHTVRLQKLGLLQPHDWKVPGDWPAIASDNSWCGFAARARVILVNTNALKDASEWPSSVMELADPKWKDRCGMAKPLFGTTATHAAVLDVQMGREKSEKFFTNVASNAQVMSGNKQVAQAVALGKLDWGLTDTDDALIELEAGLPVAIVFPDQMSAELGTLRIPNTLAILKGAPHPVAAAKLADFLVSPETEDRLAMGDSSQIPMFREVPTRPRVLPKEGVRWMDVDFEAAADNWESTAEMLERIFKL
jgi:iron(III) transport system substrate-binding protein